MNKSLIFIVLGVGALALVAGAAIFMRGKNDSPSNTNSGGTVSPSSAQNNVTVRRTQEGFMPSSLTVDKGTTVVFMNESSSDFWPASDLHPTHLLHPEFDAKHPIPPGESYTFTFTETGTYGYHDHLQSGIIGTIIVK